MKKLGLPISVLALLLSIASFFYTTSKNELVYVDINKLMEGYNRTKVEKKVFNAETNKLKANVDSLLVSWQDELKTYEKEKASMSKKELMLKQELLQNKQQQLNSYQQVVQEQIKDNDQKLTQTIVNDINDYVKEYGEEQGYNIIFGAGGNGNIMYANDISNITSDVLERLNSEYEGK